MTQPKKTTKRSTRKTTKASKAPVKVAKTKVTKAKATKARAPHARRVAKKAPQSRYARVLQRARYLPLVKSIVKPSKKASKTTKSRKVQKSAKGVKTAKNDPKTVKKGFFRPRNVALIGLLFIIVGIAGAAPTLYYTVLKRGSVNAQPFSTHVANSGQAVPVRVPITGNPVSISLPSVWINDLSIIPGYYDAKTDEWTLTLDKAQFATITKQPNDVSGLTFVYGHYRPEVFAYLHHIQPGAEATVLTDNGLRFTYVFKTTFAVPPTDTSVFNYQGPPILTVQTCSGQWFQNRQMYQFDFVKVEKV